MIHISDKSPKIFKKFLLFLGLLGAVFYPVVISPYLNPEVYRDVQKEARKNIRREDIQPGNMNIWRNPFVKDSKEKDGKEKE